MNVLIIGLGSIAKKHIHALKQLDAHVNCYALRSGEHSESVDGVTDIKSVNECKGIDFTIVSNPTAYHFEAIQQAASLKKPIFIEKPPFHSMKNTDACLSMIAENKIMTYTAFNLRFLESLLYLKKNVELKKVQEVNVYCGSYLPEWRSNVDYKKNYSANTEMGGGVHLDLIHELDYVLWIFGQPLEVKKTLRNKSSIDINAIDYANYVLVYDTFVVSIVLNYFRRDAKRTCEIVFDDATWQTNLMTNTIVNMNDGSTLLQSKQTVLDTYSDQMRYFCQAISSNTHPNNSLKESINTLKIALS